MTLRYKTHAGPTTKSPTDVRARSLGGGNQRVLQIGVAPAATISITPEPASELTSESMKNDRKRFVKRPGFWVLIGVVAAAGIGTGVGLALRRNNDAPQCGTTGDCATTQGLSVASF